MIMSRLNNSVSSSVSLSDPSFANTRSDSKVMGEKRRKLSSNESEEDFEICHKRVKMRDIESVLRSEGSETRGSESSISKETMNRLQFGQNKESLHIAENCHREPVHLQLTMPQAEKPSSVVYASSVAGNCNKTVLSKQDKDRQLGSETSRSFRFDLNADDNSNSVEKDPFYPYKVHHQLKSREDSECGSSTGPIEETDSLRKWKEMKQNGFLSISQASIPIPKRRGRKTKSETLKKKMDVAKKEEINRFTKIAAPSGLLTGLNPGIITHVRNSKQVHSIIKALVRSEKNENGKADKLTGSELIRVTKETQDQKTDPKKILVLEARGFSIFRKNEFTKGKDDAIYRAYKRVCDDTSGSSSFVSVPENRTYKRLKLYPSISMPSENISSMSSQDSTNQSSITSLSVKAATVASQWLEVVYQDIRGRLAALERSKKRLQAVIQIELPLLMAREFSSEQENASYSTNSLTVLRNSNSDVHRARWSALFGQMEVALSEEGKQLECWMNKVKEMQMHCEWGLQCVNWHDFQLRGPEDDSRLKKVGNPAKELSVKAAAASIYSTSDLIMGSKNVYPF